MILYGGDYEHTLEIRSVRHGLALDYRTLDRPELFARVLHRQPFAACEFSLSNYIMMRDRGADWLTAVPVFPARAFRHGTMLVRRDEPISCVADLSGRRVGIADYSMTAGVWARGIMAEDLGLHWSALRWFAPATPRFDPPVSAHVTPVDRDLEDALADGEIDALLAPRSRDLLLPQAARRFRPLLPDWQAAERRWFERTGIYPISHVVVLHQAEAERRATLPVAVVEAYQHAKQRARQRRLASTFLPWGEATWRDTMAMFGEDPMPYGLCVANRAVIDRLQDYLMEQELTTRRWTFDELFRPC
ncbi:substrate-binding domain-containing protein [Neoroseomonas lacus]|uniref:4,5-dihydroxyphthalate decarboxylase n=1 Tax=Neoroseomonas lacus TaxID=287609 RepID=A0A917KZX7_9PROT|nr:hypothetical protein [Neoroseomonas lacus]GGJ35373.1 4,5-dihydroxyphthalate decarboxylase [Neoroseomonas lacus]